MNKSSIYIIPDAHIAQVYAKIGVNQERIIIERNKQKKRILLIKLILEFAFLNPTIPPANNVMPYPPITRSTNPFTKLGSMNKK